MNIVNATVPEVPSILARPYEHRPLQFFGICNIISRISLLGGLGSPNTKIATATASDLPGVQGGPYERRPPEFYWDL